MRKYNLIFWIFIFTFTDISQAVAFELSNNNLIEVCQKLTMERLNNPDFREWKVDRQNNEVIGLAIVRPLLGKAIHMPRCVFNYRGMQLVSIFDLKRKESWDVTLYNNSIEWKNVDK